MSRALLAAVWILGSSGCAYRLAMTSDPAGAQVELPDGTVITMPNETTLKWAPFGSQEVTVRAVGYRPLTVDLRQTEVRWGHYLRDAVFRPSTLTGSPRGSVEWVLVPEHGASGTWTADEVP